jgi:mycothiol synthase
LVIIRNFRPHDIADYAHLVNEIDEVNGLGKVSSIAQMEEHLRRPGCHPHEDLFFAELDGLLVGFAELTRELEIGRVILEGAVHPKHRGQGVGTRLLEIAIDHSRRLGAKVVSIPVVQGTQAAAHLARKEGFRVVRRHWQMSLTQCGELNPQIPHGFELRHFALGDEGSLCALQNLAFADSWGFRPNTVEEIRHLVNCGLCHPEGVLFISDEGRLIGYCWTIDDASDRQKGFIRMMGVAPPYHGRGLGRAILMAGIGYLRRRGMTTIKLTVDSRNTSAKRLYQSVGFKRIGTTLWYEKRLSPR